jgi:hypothetical protein
MLELQTGTRNPLPQRVEQGGRDLASSLLLRGGRGASGSAWSTRTHIHQGYGKTRPGFRKTCGLVSQLPD